MVPDGLSVIFLTYNRADLLQIANRSLSRGLADGAPWPIETIISDDGSDSEHLDIIDRIPADRKLFGHNSGLSANHNRAIDACTYDRILSLQDDWEYVGSLLELRAAMDVLDEDSEVGSVNFLPPPAPLPGQQRHTRAGQSYTVFANDGLPEMRPSGDRPYSDRPHIKRRQFADDLGAYREDLSMTKAELEFQQRVACQIRWKIAYVSVSECFVHIGAERSFNPAALRHARIEQLQRVPVIGTIYRLSRAYAKALLGLLARR